MTDDYFQYYLSHVKAKKLLTFLMHENQNCSPHFSQKSMLHSAVKSQLLGILEHGTNTTYKQPDAEIVIMNDTTLINAISSRAANI